MHSMPEEPYRELRALFDRLVETVQAARDQVGPPDHRLAALDDVLRQAHTYQQTSCERCSAPFRREALHAESYAVAGYARVCPRCNREVRGAPDLEGDDDDGSTP